VRPGFLEVSHIVTANGSDSPKQAEDEAEIFTMPISARSNRLSIKDLHDHTSKHVQEDIHGNHVPTDEEDKCPCRTTAVVEEVGSGWAAKRRCYCIVVHI